MTFIIKAFTEWRGPVENEIGYDLVLIVIWEYWNVRSASEKSYYPYPLYASYSVLAQPVQ
jgi:hypothetical protein